MDRFARRYGYLLAIAALATLLAAGSGCRSLFFVPLYLLRGNDIPAEYEGLKKKKVAVVCQSVVMMSMGEQFGAPAELARELNRKLAEGVPKIRMVDQQKVEAWIDEGGGMGGDFDYTELGRDLGAEMVVVVELEGFSLEQSTVLYQGKADVQFTVYDMADGKVTFDKPMPQVVHPPNSGVEKSATREVEFRREFIGVLADRIGRHFYAHDKYADFASDAKAMK
ncbi:MAG: hypothetical protein HQ567_28970 [Candidatus Nealsonbacteria bacterium]|nr:hypothetical protein [Candidatus Nealsonbacteria bacterium]